MTSESNLPDIGHVACDVAMRRGQRQMLEETQRTQRWVDEFSEERLRIRAEAAVHFNSDGELGGASDRLLVFVDGAKVFDRQGGVVRLDTNGQWKAQVRALLG